MNPLQWIGNLFSLADKVADIAKEVVTDKDKQNELIAHLDEMKSVTTYLAELQTETIPWIDGLHKMGRQILNLCVLIVWLIGMIKGHTFTQYDLLIIGGGNVAYQLIKGGGK